jgi:UDP-glucose 4-epimerase
MRILFTGSSSFTGFWFVKELVAAGHEVIATYQRQPDEYADKPRQSRVRAVSGICEPVFGVSFGDDSFMALLKAANWDVLCHHGADVTNYRSPAFDIAGAVAKSTYRLPLVLDTLLASGCRNVIVTGSVFEPDEGAGSDGGRAFSPYGLSKAFTWQMFRYYADVRQMTLGKFVIANPFGPFEEPRFTHHLMKCWFAGLPAAVNTPLYVRDNIHVSLLAKAYARYVVTLAQGISRCNPSGYVESQGAFTERVAREMRRRLGLQCAFELGSQTEFSEPYIRINTEPCDAKTLGWDEATAWDGIASYYTQLLGQANVRNAVSSG